MGFYKRLTEHLNLAPQFWILDTGIAAVLVGLLTWSWPTFLATSVLLILCLSAPRLRRYYLLTWALCWVVVWWQFVAISREWLGHAQDAIERLPLYVAITIGGLFLLRWMVSALVAPQPAQDHQQAPGNRPEKPLCADPCASQHPDPYHVLGITSAATATEVKTAYRRLMSLYHPDKVAHLGDRLQTTANEQSREIQRAYDGLRGGSI